MPFRNQPFGFIGSTSNESTRLALNLREALGESLRAFLGICEGLAAKAEEQLLFKL